MAEKCLSQLIDANAALGANAQIMRLASQGDLGAQRHCRDACNAAVRPAIEAGVPAEAHAHALEAMIWARMAAFNGDHGDATVLAQVLGCLAEFWDHGRAGSVGDNLMGEAISILDRMASAGDEQAATLITCVAGSLPQHTLLRAAQITEEVNAQES